MLGRGGSKFQFGRDKVIKLSASIEEAIFMDAHPKVFIPVLKTTPLTMPHWREPIIGRENQYALVSGLHKLKNHLWSHSSPYLRENWRLLLEHHLHLQRRTHRLDFNEDLIDRTVRSIKVSKPRLIHGDATLANMLANPDTGVWRWIDPLERTYIPGDPHVDLGKLFQSCWEYERILIDASFKGHFNMVFAHQLAEYAGLDYNQGQLWCIIHIMRLLPYQEARVRIAFEEILSCIFSTSMEH